MSLFLFTHFIYVRGFTPLKFPSPSDGGTTTTPDNQRDSLREVPGDFDLSHRFKSSLSHTSVYFIKVPLHLRYRENRETRGPSPSIRCGCQTCKDCTGIYLGSPKNSQKFYLNRRVWGPDPRGHRSDGTKRPVPSPSVVLLSLWTSSSLVAELRVRKSCGGCR